MTAPPTIAPRVAYNQALAHKFGLGAEYPSVTKQLEVVPFNRRALRPFAYNPSICRWGTRILMAYRHHAAASDWKTSLRMVEFDASFKILKEQAIDFVESSSHEDPRLFLHDKSLWIAWVESITGQNSIVRYGRLEEGKSAWKVPEPFQPKYGQNDSTAYEKNWVFFSHEDQIRFIYHNAPMIVCSVKGTEATRVFEDSKIPYFAFGRRAGGTPFLPFTDNLIRFWHSSLDNESNMGALNNPVRRYYLGATVYDESWSVLKQSTLPIVRGSEVSDLSETEVTQCGHYKSNVVFVSGAIAMPDGSWILSVGINDSQCALLRVKQENLNL